MATITLDYNTRNVQAQKALEYILSLGYFEAHSVRRLHKKSRLKVHSAVNALPFTESFGMWAGRDIDIKEIRQRKRERRTKLYDNATL
ncbi:MAG: hypothetical protein LBN27_08735 [Prevotellaceae bacterium]|jgi:hypothetical protein|nr:hypothetical protein [Prevotellaceae bacterium]